MSARRRADLVLVERGFFESRTRARAAIEAGLVAVDGAAIRRPSDPIGADADIRAEPPHPWVSRGGVKLAAALDAFGLDPGACVCLDLGASTGGFTDVLLTRGAARVYAVDVGHGQLHPRVAADPRVVSLEGTDARRIAERVPEPAGFATADLSFISLRLVVPALVAAVAPGAPLVLLVKPQFEVGRGGLGRGGIVRDEEARADAVAAVAAALREAGAAVDGTVPSPIAGGDGNQEYLIGAHRV